MPFLQGGFLQTRGNGIPPSAATRSFNAQFPRNPWLRSKKVFGTCGVFSPERCASPPAGDAKQKKTHKHMTYERNAASLSPQPVTPRNLGVPPQSSGMWRRCDVSVRSTKDEDVYQRLLKQKEERDAQAALSQRSKACLAPLPAPKNPAQNWTDGLASPPQSPPPRQRPLRRPR
eukprot:gene22238-biopygen23705